MGEALVGRLLQTVVTGATDGIGKAYAHELGRRGMNIVLISRSQEKLDDVASEIKSKSNVQTRTISIDFSGGPEIYAKIDKETSDLDVGVLVNNVGMSYNFPMYFTEADAEKKMDMINVNATSATMMMHYFMPRMTAKKRGAILNISSASACYPNGFLAVYSATKCKLVVLSVVGIKTGSWVLKISDSLFEAYVDFLTRAMQQEYKSSGVILQCVKPYLVATKMSKIRRSNFVAPSPSSYARAALNTVGVQGSTFGCLSHELQGFLLNKIFPTWLLENLYIRTMKIARERGFKKLQSKKD